MHDGAFVYVSYHGAGGRPSELSEEDSLNEGREDGANVIGPSGLGREFKVNVVCHMAGVRHKNVRAYS